jgi:group I intron endonuclease
MPRTYFLNYSFVERNVIVYLITNKINGKRYVGQTSQTLARRWKRHQYSFPHRRASYLYNAIQKYGVENFEVKPLIIVGNKVDMDYYEQSLIKMWDLKNPEKGYNLTDGGGGMLGFHLSEQTKRRMSEHIKSEEHRKNISKAKIGNKSRLGILHSEETKRLMSEKAKGRIFSEEHRHNLSLAQQHRWRVNRNIINLNCDICKET